MHSYYSQIVVWLHLIGTSALHCMHVAPENDFGLQSTGRILGCGTIRFEEIAIFPSEASPAEIAQIMMENGTEEQKAIMNPMGQFDVDLLTENGKRFICTPLSQDQVITDTVHIFNWTSENTSPECASVSFEFHMGPDFNNPSSKAAAKWEFRRVPAGIQLTRHLGWMKAPCPCCWMHLTCPCLPPSSMVPLYQVETVNAVKGILEKYQKQQTEKGQAKDEAPVASVNGMVPGQLQ